MSKIKKNIADIKNYCISLLWINKEKNIDQLFIHPAEIAEELISLFLTPALNWAKAHPEAEVDIWYDSSLYASEPIVNTSNILDHLKSISGTNNIHLKDIREIKAVIQNQDLFSEWMPLYSRIDSLKIIILLHSLLQGMDAAIFSDLEVGELRSDGQRMNKEELFKQGAMEKLEKFGIVTNEHAGGLENQFIQVLNNEPTIEALRHGVNACLMREVTVLNLPTDIRDEMVKIMYKTSFYCTINELHKIYKGMIEPASMKVRADFVGIESGEEWVNYNLPEHGYEPLGNILQKRSETFSYYDAESGLYTRRNDFFNFDKNDSDDERGREMDTRSGNSHMDIGYIIPDGHFTYVPWEREQILDGEVSKLIGENN